MKNFILSLLSLFCAFSAFSQNNFTVLALSGNVTMNNEALYVGQVLSNDFQVKVGTDSYLGLIHESGKPVELKDAAVYTTKDISAKLSTGDASFSDQFANYISEELNSSEGAYQNNMSVTGSVERAIKDFKLFIPLPKKSTFVGQELDIIWMDNTEEESGEYEVLVMDMMEDIVYSTVTKETSFSLNMLNEENIESDDFYLIKIRKTGSDAVSNVVGIYIPDEEDLKQLQSDIKPLLDDQASTLEIVAAAQLLKNKNYHSAALSKYKEALAKEPNNKVVKDAFDSYVKELE